MALTYTESAKLSNNQLAKGVIESIEVKNPLLDRLAFIEVNGKAYVYNERATLPGVAWRAVTGSYTADTGTVNNSTEVLKILGGITEVDRFQQMGMSDVNDQLAIQMVGKGIALSKEFNNNFFNGEDGTDPNQWDGLKARLTGGQVITAATNGLTVIGDGADATLMAFFDKLQEMIDAVSGKPDAIYMNASILSKVKSSAMRLKMNLESGLDNFGKKVTFFDGVPMLDPGEDNSGAKILPQTETCGTSSVTSSIYAVKFSTNETEIGVAGLTYGGLMVERLPRVDTKERGLVELYSGIAVFGGKAAARLKGVLNS